MKKDDPVRDEAKLTRERFAYAVQDAVITLNDAMGAAEIEGIGLVCVPELFLTGIGKRPNVRVRVLHDITAKISR